jgi:hypothetical protein
MNMAKTRNENEETPAAPPKVDTKALAADKARYPGDIVRDKKTGKKAKFLNEYGTNGRACIVLPNGAKRSELWDAASLEIIKKVKRPVAPTAEIVPQLGEDEDDEAGVEDTAEDDS